ncbi:MAG: hypothetical protein HC897_04280 [Thermoanaerobaculia bacterium]|nr:hypothetical protein [Thermoanaerobaculia bacterium]
MKQGHAASGAVSVGTGSVPVIGIDVGQKRDPTAIAVVETHLRPIGDPAARQSKSESHYFVRFLQRLPLGTPYPEVARRLGEIWQRAEQRSRQPPRVFVDATGVGTPIVDLLRAQIPAAYLWAVTFTHGRRRTTDHATRKVSLGKAHLVSHLQVLLRDQRLHLPQHSEARALAEELLTYEIRVDENAVDRYGAFRVGTHDDLVTALGLAIQDEPRR